MSPASVSPASRATAIAWRLGTVADVVPETPTAGDGYQARALVELGHDPELEKTKRFGPTGGSV